MRRLADAMGIKAASLYWHFRTSLRPCYHCIYIIQFFCHK